MLVPILLLLLLLLLKPQDMGHDGRQRVEERSVTRHKVLDRGAVQERCAVLCCAVLCCAKLCAHPTHHSHYPALPLPVPDALIGLYSIRVRHDTLLG
jgi:hypothetical protein